MMVCMLAQTLMLCAATCTISRGLLYIFDTLDQTFRCVTRRLIHAPHVQISIMISMINETSTESTGILILLLKTSVAHMYRSHDQ